MANPAYIVVRLVPDSPVDGATFATYLDGLSLQVIDAYTGVPWSDCVYSSPLILMPWPSISDYLSIVSAPTAESTPYDSTTGNYGNSLTFDSTDGITVGSFVFTSDATSTTTGTIPSSPPLQVSQVTAATASTPGTVTLSGGTLSDNVPPGTVVTFLGQFPNPPVTTPGFSFTLPTNAAATTIDGNPVTQSDPLRVLYFAKTSGITVGMGVSGDPAITAGTTVVAVTSTSVTVSQALSASLPTPPTVIFTLNPPYASLSLTPSSGTPAAAPTKLKFSGGTSGIATGMTLTTSVAGLIAPGTTVTGVTATTITISPALLAALPASTSITFTFPLSSGIVQHTETLSIPAFWSTVNLVIPASVATAVIPLNPTPPLPDYLDITINAQRGFQIIPVNNTFYNVLVQTGAIPTPDQYQSIPSTETSLYISLPPQPGINPISLVIPSDGSAPPFDPLYAAVQTALANDPIQGIGFPLTPLSGTPAANPTTLTFAAGQTNTIAIGMAVVAIPGLILPGTSVTGKTSATISLSQPLAGHLPAGPPPFVVTFTSVAELITSPASCARIAYDIVWSTQSTLPAPPDPLESLYTNPPNPGGSADNSGGSDSTNSLETDRQKFEGTLNSFYATNDATAQRLTKFVAAVSAAVFCEQTSLNSTAALLEFPVDPSFTFAGEVESEILLQGLGVSGTSGIQFGVPAAFFYALGANLDENTTALQRFQIASGSAIEQILQQLALAENASVITDSENFVTPSLSSLGITSFQAARRLVALAVSAASTSPSVTLSAGSPPALLKLINDWLTTIDPTPTPAPNPQLTYENTDFNIWTQLLAGADPQGYLYLDLSALTQGYVIPPFTANPNAATASGSTLTFDPFNSQGIATGIGVGMLVSGTNIAPGTTITAAVTVTTVTLSADVSPGGVTTTSDITFSSANSSTTASPNASVTSGAILTFAATPGTEGITPGMLVSGTEIPTGTTVKTSITTTAVTLSTPVLGSGVLATTVLEFNGITATTTADCPTQSMLTFAGVPSGITVGMSVQGPNIVPGTTVKSKSSTTVTLTTAVSADVPSGSVIQFGGSSGITATTTADCPAALLTFAAGTTSGIAVGMSVSGTNIVTGTTVTAVSSTTVTLNAPVSSDVPAGSVITFVLNPVTLADQIAAWLPSSTSPPTPLPTVATLKQVTATEWTNFFTYTGNPTWLPPFTQPVAPGVSGVPVTQKPGYTAMRIRAFIRAVQQFFTVSSVATSAQLPLPGAPPTFALPAFDPIGQAVSQIIVSQPGFQFGQAITATNLTTAVQFVFPTALEAQVWLTQAITTINELYEIASVIPNPIFTPPLPNPVSFTFSVVEALYARGFRSASDITNLSAADFQQALTGTGAYDFANSGATSLYAEAQTIAPSSPSTTQSGGSFQPINPDGSLVNCVPPPCLSPTGPIAYLQEMLNLSQASTCGNPWAAPASGQTTLGAAVTARRGPLGSLLASCANLETPLPLIDIVNECLEYLGAPQPPPATPPDSGTVYDTSADQLAGLALCQERDCSKEEARWCHEPDTIFAALPEYSSPATPVTANQSVEPLVYNNLKVDFSSCHLPYSQALDVSRTYLRHFRTCRFEELRTFRKCITEFALSPANPPVGFQSFLWRYPVRIETAIEYLGITPEEYTMLFQGTSPQSCGVSQGNAVGTVAGGVPVTGVPVAGVPVAGVPVTSVPVTGAPVTAVPVTGAPVTGAPAAGPSAAELYGFSSTTDDSWTSEVVVLSEFLSRTCLTYCEFLELSKCGLVQLAYGNGDDNGTQTAVPDCEPCCLKDYRLQFPQGYAPNQTLDQTLLQLAVFIRLWRKLKDQCSAGYTFQQLYDICTVLQLFIGGIVNPEFIRQLAAFQILRDHFNLPLVDHADKATGTTGANRTHLLALWVGSSAKKWNWAIDRLLEGVEFHARGRYGCVRRRGEGIAHIAGNLDALSRLAGFNPPTATNPSTDTWNSNPGCTLRFAEVLAKISASNFRIGELFYLFNAVPPQDYEDPFPLQDSDDALNYPLDLPENEHDHTLWKLREQLLAVEVREEEVEEVRRWTWHRFASEFRDRFGYAPPSGQDPLLSIGQHFFPGVLEASGFSVSAQQRQYQSTLTSSTSWNLPGSPFQYNSSSTQLWIQLPLRDEAVAATLSQLPELNSAEQVAVQDLYFAPRVDLAFLTFFFPDWQSAEIHLIQERDEARRWTYLLRHFVLANARRKVIADHLAKHVAHRTGCCSDDLDRIAGLVLSSLLSDENTGTPWESDSGVPPTVMWTPLPSGGAIAALLGLVGTGLLGEYEIVQPQNTGNKNAANPPVVPGVNYQVIWREVRGPLEAFGHERDITNSPVPTVLPAIGLSPAANPLITFNNGYAVRNSDGLRLGGAQAICVRWSGVLLVEREGEYAFHAGAPSPHGEEPGRERAEKAQWRVMLKRGQKTWTVLNYQWPGDKNSERSEPRLRRGAYQIVIEFSQPAPSYTGSHIHPQHTGFEVKYAGPDTDDRVVTLPVKHLYRDFQNQTLDQGIQFLNGSKNAQAFLRAFYTSTLRDIRRTYQRAFKAVLFAGKLGLSARTRDEDGQSELGYMLGNSALFAGHSYYRTSSTTFVQHLVDFDFNFLPLQDNYYPPVPVPPDRSTPSLQQTQAMFDWWERLFDYDLVRKEIRPLCKGPLWHIFNEALLNPPTDVAELLRHIGAEPRYWQLDLRFYQDQNSAIYSVSSTDLQDDRWLVRAWHADRWIRRLLNRFHSRDISKARPDLWAALDPSAPLPLSGVSETGNANLSGFITDGCLENGEPRRYLDLKRLNDGLRERCRNALTSYLCRMNRVALPWMSTATFATAPHDLSDLLLLDVETGICEKASRIEEAITAVQTFVRRNRLGLEQDWKVTCEFARLWDSRFETYHTWERCKRRELYRENWIQWEELGKARRVEAFRFLESQLRSSTLTMAAPGGLDWWADDDKSLEHAPELVQRRVPSELTALTPPPQSATREGLGTLGRPEYASMPSWLAPVPQTGGSGSGSSVSGPSGSALSGSTPSGSAPSGSTQAASAANLAVTPRTAQSLVQAAATGGAQPQVLPFWMEAAMRLGTKFVRVAAAGVPQAALAFVPHPDEPQNVCCHECGCHHPVLVDEYYFWLVNSQLYAYTDQTDAQSNPDVSFIGSYQFGFQDLYWDQYQQQSAEWNDEDQVPSLLAKWTPNSAVRLAWCRVHNGKFGQPRRSDEYVAIADPADLVFLGRAGDSLYFEVNGSAPLPPGYGGTNGDTSPPGFRYDLPTDLALALPQVAKPPAPAITYPGGLLSYPFFAYNDPGARLFPGSWFSPSLIVADTLRAHCGYELALRWYKRAFDPLQQNCAWMDCDSQQPQPQPTPTPAPTPTRAPTPEPTQDEIATKAYQIWEQHGRPPAEQKEDWLEAEKTLEPPNPVVGTPVREPAQQGACCDSTKVTQKVIRNRAVTLHFCQTLVDWGDALMRCRRSPEAFQQARLIFDMAAKIMGRCPQTVLLQEPATPQPVSSFTPAYAPLNPRLLDLYSLVADRLGLIHNCFDKRRLRNGRPNKDMPYFGDSPFREGWRTIPETCDDERECCRPSPYRFTYRLQKALEIAGKLHEQESALTSAYEKIDAERLAAIHAEQEREMLTLGLSIKQDQWREADWEVQALQQTKDLNQTNLLYYNNLYQAGLINDEIQNISLATNAMQTRIGANIAEAIAESFKIFPDSFVGAMSTFIQIPTGTKLAGLFETIGKVMQTIADVQSSTAAIDMTEAGWQRRSAEWFNHMLTLPIDIEAGEMRILGAHRRRGSALQELNNHQRQIEHAIEVQDFLRDKFTATELYLHLQKETLALHSMMCKLAHEAALEAQRTYNFERGHTTGRFIPDECCDNLQEGLMAGARLEYALRHMEKAYLDENVREYELTKHFSLRLHFPWKFLELKLTGCCDLEFPEWMYDLDYPGQYMRRIRNVSLTIPCVTGPYTGVHCRLTLLSDLTRIDPRIEVPATHCCCECRSSNGYEGCPHDPRFVRCYEAREAIVTSSGQNDSCLLELSYRDERYLPFEFRGATCRSRVEMRHENNYFPIETMTDLVVNVNFTSREGGEPLRRAATEAAQKHLPGSGWCFFDVRHEFPDAWQLLRNSCCGEDGRGARLGLRMERKMFPFIPGSREVLITGMAILFDARERDGDRPCDQPPGECPCPQEGRPASRVLEFCHRTRDRGHDDALRVSCLTSEEWPDVYYGVFDTRVGPLGRYGDCPEVEFRFPVDVGEVERVFLLCRYERWQQPC